MIDTINEHQARLVWSELVFIVLEVLIFFVCLFQVVRLGNRPAQSVGTISSTAVLMSLVIGMAVSAYWVAYSMRLQLRLKLR
jgi:cation transporter-like permease